MKAIAKEVLQSKIEMLGFDDVGFTDITDIPDQKESLEEYLKNGYHGDMIWLEKNKERRYCTVSRWRGKLLCR